MESRVQHPFHIKDFNILLLTRLFSGIARQILFVSLAWQVYQLTHDALALGFMGLAEALPFIVFSLWAGHVADRYEKRSIMIRSISGVAMGTVLLVVYISNASMTAAAAYVVLGLVGLLNSFEFSSSAAYLQLLVPRHIFQKAAAWNLITFQSSMILGPVVGGFILKVWGPMAAYGAVIVSSVLAAVLVTFVRKAHPLGIKDDVKGFQAIAEGLRFIRGESLILSCMILDMFAMMVGDCIALFPIFADMHHAGPMGLGFMRAMPSVGSLSMSLFVGSYPFFTPSWKSLRVAVISFGLCMIAFALCPWFHLSLLFLVFGGMSDSVSVITRQSIYQARTPDHLRGRVAAVNGMFLASSNELGAFESGVVARFIGVVSSVVVGGALAIGSVGVMSAVYAKWKKQEVVAG